MVFTKIVKIITQLLRPFILILQGLFCILSRLFDQNEADYFIQTHILFRHAVKHHRSMKTRQTVRSEIAFRIDISHGLNGFRFAIGFRSRHRSHHKFGIRHMFLHYRVKIRQMKQSIRCIIVFATYRLIGIMKQKVELT